MALFLVSTPIGNLKDVTERAKETLAQVSGVVAEDTRRTGLLLRHLNLEKPLVRYDEHVHARVAPALLDRLAAGEDLALVTDAGTPGLSDPGGRLVPLAVERAIAVVPIPGPSALLTALAGSGLPWDRFTFLGFLPRRPGRFCRELESAGKDRTVVFYESPHRVVAALEMALSVYGDVPASVARELTKIHEEFIRGRLSEVAAVLKAREKILGEITVVVSPQLGEKS
ncbi:MAG: 16S rRNA (cytidine(1402)-2'-O)-methyltransferase [Elusimicrobia bacterium]|nr:16S rRNA (cytidine(1402)-2'-O)-methyltransferase [Elusimicrobiota bacterium]MBP9699347.1 16S rRNA (cytidine(1402)-2'-O)-methyltransferase [Elusimicrobiota bacterium]